MSSGSRLLGFASTVALVAGLTVPAFAQSAPGTPPEKVPVPNSGTQVQCNSNGTATVTSGPNAETSASNNVPGTPVTQTNPNGTGTTTTQTPTMTKPASAAQVNCPKTAPATPATPQQNAVPAAPQNSAPSMDALNNNPNGPGWVDKFNRPMVSHSTMKTKKHHKRATGGGGH